MAYSFSSKNLKSDLGLTLKAKKNVGQSDIVFVNDIGLRKNGIAINDQVIWLSSRDETIKVVSYCILANLDFFNRLCTKCGVQTPELFNYSCNNNCSCCGAKRKSLMHYKTILKTKYKIEF